MGNKYTLSETIRTIYSLILTKIFYHKARLIRRPFYIRGKKSMEFGKNLTTGYSCRFDLQGKNKTLFIGNNCQMGDNVHIVAHERVEIGDNCLFASKIFISDTSHGIYNNTDETSNPNYPPNDRKLYSKSVSIGNNVWVGENVVILLGVSIGDGAIIGANSVINKDVPANSIVAGSPGRVIKTWSDEANKWISVDRR